MKHLTYAVLTFCFLILLTANFTPLTAPEAHGDAAHYRVMAQGEMAPQPFQDRIFIPKVIQFLSTHIDITSWTFDVVENVDAWFFVVTFLCLWGTAGLVRLSMMRLGVSDDAADLAGYLYLSTFWLSGYQLSNFWLQDPFINLVIWIAIYLWTFRWWYGVLGFILALGVKGGVLGYNWAVISMACKFYEDIPALFYAFGFLWLPVVLVDRKLLAILAVVFLTGRIVTADVARAGVAVFSFPVLLGVCRFVDMSKYSTVAMMLIFLVHLWQQIYWVFQK